MVNPELVNCECVCAFCACGGLSVCTRSLKSSIYIYAPRAWVAEINRAIYIIVVWWLGACTCTCVYVGSSCRESVVKVRKKKHKKLFSAPRALAQQPQL